MATVTRRDLSHQVDVASLDVTVAVFYGTGSKDEGDAADQILQRLQDNADIWHSVLCILQNTKNPNTKFLALQVLEGAIKYRWNVLSVEQRDGMKNHILNAILQLSSNEASFRMERLYVNKLNVILVQILKREWCARWRWFFPCFISAAETNETVCENYMAILKLLIEEVFYFSGGEMMQQSIFDLQRSMGREFEHIHDLSLHVLSTSQRIELISATLSTLHTFLPRARSGYIFGSHLLEMLLKFFPMASYRNLSLQCLTEVAARGFGKSYHLKYVNMYKDFMVQLQGILPPSTNIPEAYAHGSSEEQAFIENLALFFTSYYKLYIHVLESTQENVASLLLGLEYLINISYVDDTEVFKVCLDYWNKLVFKLTLHYPDGIESSLAQQGFQLLQRRQLYAGIMSKLRMLMICRMAKPEEVLIVEDENGNIVHETMEDNDAHVQYKTMRETLIDLSYLDRKETERLLLKKLIKFLSGKDWSWNNLNTLCWAIGSILGSMAREQENRILVMAICVLSKLFAKIKEKDKKAVIASNIMYVAGQCRFRTVHWKFFKTLVKKLFKFMHETYPGLKDMACDTFLKIVQGCNRSKFIIVQGGENEPFVSQLLTGMATTIADLKPHQIHSFYESVGHLIEAEGDPQKRDEYLQRLMDLQNRKWKEIISQAHQSIDFLEDQVVVRAVLNVLQTNTSVASALGSFFLSQFSLIFMDMLHVYRMCSELISSTIVGGGPYVTKSSFVNLLRLVERETLKLIETFLDKAEDQPQIREQFVPLMMDPILSDYASNVPDARESDVLSLFTTIISRYKGVMIEDMPRIFEAVFLCSLEVITKNCEDDPEHPLKFLSLLHAIALHCSPALIRLSSQHLERNIAEMGLNLLLVMLKNFQASEFCNDFYRTYYLKIEEEIFSVLTDTLHKPGFKLHVLVLQHLFSLAQGGALMEPLWETTTASRSYPDNTAYVRECTINLLHTSFQNMRVAEVTQFVNDLLESTNDLPVFKYYIRDFLVQSKGFSAQDNKDLNVERDPVLREREREGMRFFPRIITPSNGLLDAFLDEVLD